MYSKYSCLVLLLSVVYSVNTEIASFLPIKCKADDSKCLKEVTQASIPKFAAGVPELGIEILDPFHMKTLDASTPGLNLKLWDVTGTGLTDCIAKKVQRDVTKSNLKVKLECNVDFAGKYEMKGQIVKLPIEGKGNAHVVLNKIVISAEVDIGENIGKDGQKHWTIKNWSHTYDLKDKSVVELENLFNGNEILGRAARELLENNSNLVVKEVGPPIVKAIVGKIVGNVNNFFQSSPISALSLD